MSDDPRVTVPAELVDALRDATENWWTSKLTETQESVRLHRAACALVDAAERPAAPVSEPLCRCGHKVGHHFAPRNGECRWCDCKDAQPPVPVTDNLDAKLSGRPSATSDGLGDEAEAAWHEYATANYGMTEHTPESAFRLQKVAFIAGFRAARLTPDTEGETDE